MNGPRWYDENGDAGVVGVCWFVVPVCISFGLGAVREPARRRVFGAGRWPSAT